MPARLLVTSVALEVILSSLIKMAEKPMEVKVILLKTGLLNKDMLTGKKEPF